MKAKIFQLTLLIVAMTVFALAEAAANSGTRKRREDQDRSTGRANRQRQRDDDSDRENAQSEFQATFNNRAAVNDGGRANARGWGMRRNMERGRQFISRQRPTHLRTGEPHSSEEEEENVNKLEYAACCDAGISFCSNVSFPSTDEEQSEFIQQYRLLIDDNARDVAEGDNDARCIQNYGNCCFKVILEPDETNPFPEVNYRQESSRSQRNRPARRLHGPHRIQTTSDDDNINPNDNDRRGSGQQGRRNAEYTFQIPANLRFSDDNTRQSTGSNVRQNGELQDLLDDGNEEAETSVDETIGDFPATINADLLRGTVPLPGNQTHLPSPIGFSNTNRTFGLNPNDEDVPHPLGFGRYRGRNADAGDRFHRFRGLRGRQTNTEDSSGSRSEGRRGFRGHHRNENSGNGRNHVSP